MKISIKTLEPLNASKEAAEKLAGAPHGLPVVGNYVVAPPDMMAARIIHQVQIKYPESAMQMRMQGTVVLGEIIDKNGTVSHLHLMKSASKLLDGVALRATHQSRYKPMIVDSKAVAVDTTTAVNFSLSE